MAEPQEYGARYYCVHMAKELSEDGEIFVYADKAYITTNGDLILLGGVKPGDRGNVMLAVAAGQWTAIHAASTVDGHSVAAVHRKRRATPKG